MGLFSLFRRREDSAKAPAQPADAADSVRQARVRARRRLIGATLLVVVGVIGFPLVFETQPRPIPVDIPIEIPRKEGLPPLVMPQARSTAPVPIASVPATRPEAVPLPSDAASSVVAVPAESRSVASAPPVKTAPSPATAVAPKAEPAAAPNSGDAARAQALLDGKDTTKPGGQKDGARFVVQVGAFAENTAAHETRLKVEKLGLKTYAQVADTDAGKRIRVRVGPFASKDDAEQAKGRLKAAGFPAVLLTL